jgi:hypothetical protein
MQPASCREPLRAEREQGAAGPCLAKETAPQGMACCWRFGFVESSRCAATTDGDGRIRRSFDAAVPEASSMPEVQSAACRLRRSTHRWCHRGAALACVSTLHGGSFRCSCCSISTPADLRRSEPECRTRRGKPIFVAAQRLGRWQRDASPSVSCCVDPCGEQGRRAGAVLRGDGLPRPTRRRSSGPTPRGAICPRNG